MKRFIMIAGLAMVSLSLVFACSKQEEPAQAPKAATAPKPAAAKGGQKPGPTPAEEKHGQNSDLNQALLAYLAKTGIDAKYVDPHLTALIDLNGDGRPDALVLLENPMYFCGTGGCTMLVFQGTPSGFQFVSSSTLIRGPVLVSETNTRGWRDLIVEVSGGGMAPKLVALKYKGGKYPLNPSILPPLPKNRPVKGTKVFEDNP
jgi:putative lipoprotein